MIDPITDSDLEAYVDGQLDVMRRLEVEAHLAQRPDVAARVMADLRDRDALREVYAHPLSGEPERLRQDARRLDRAFAWQRAGLRLRRAAAIAVLVGAGWLAHSETGTIGVPDTIAATFDRSIIEDAEQARQAVLARARTQTQRASSAYDQDDLEAATGLDLPDLPSDWTVRDVQIFPSRHGPGVEVAIDAGSLGELSLFATRGSKGATEEAPKRSEDGATAYWQAGQTTYALSGGRQGSDLNAALLKLAARH